MSTLQNCFLVVMAGGSGTRFWPKSTSRRPKQLLRFGETPETLLQQTLSRFSSIVPKNQQWIITSRTIEAAVKEQAGEAVVFAEPQGRNTAPCIYWAARMIAEKDPKALMLVMPSDHYIPRLRDYLGTIDQAVNWAATHDDLVTLGVKPSRPETGYGYLRAGVDLERGARKVEAFVEKPDLVRAQEFVNSGKYLWNGGMFVWRAEVILKAFDEAMPEMAQAWNASGGKVEDAFPRMTATSIDFGVMEKAQNVVSFTLDCGWDDLGSWISVEGLADELKAHKEGNVVSAGDLIAVESSGNIVDAAGKVVALVGVRDLVVVHDGASILIASKDRAQDVKMVVERLKGSRPDLV